MLDHSTDAAFLCRRANDRFFEFLLFGSRWANKGVTSFESISSHRHQRGDWNNSAAQSEHSTHVHHSYLALQASSGGNHSGSAGIMVKGYSRRPDQVEAWKRWLTFEERWDLLPAS